MLGQVAAGYGLDDLAIGAPVEVVVEPLEERDGVPRLVWRWRPTTADGLPSTRVTADGLPSARVTADGLPSARVIEEPAR